eukprot:354272-Chlamydomonas_euryale.AAC.4
MSQRHHTSRNNNSWGGRPDEPIRVHAHELHARSQPALPRGPHSQRVPPSACAFAPRGSSAQS